MTLAASGDVDPGRRLAQPGEHGAGEIAAVGGQLDDGAADAAVAGIQTGEQQRGGRRRHRRAAAPRGPALDEPTERIRPLILLQIERGGGLLRDRGDRAIRLVGPSVSFARALADRVAVMGRGRSVRAGRKGELDEAAVRARPAVRDWPRRPSVRRGEAGSAVRLVSSAMFAMR